MKEEWLGPPSLMLPISEEGGSILGINYLYLTFFELQHQVISERLPYRIRLY